MTNLTWPKKIRSLAAGLISLSLFASSVPSSAWALDAVSADYAIPEGGVVLPAVIPNINFNSGNFIPGEAGKNNLSNSLGSQLSSDVLGNAVPSLEKATLPLSSSGGGSGNSEGSGIVSGGDENSQIVVLLNGSSRSISQDHHMDVVGFKEYSLLRSSALRLKAQRIADQLSLMGLSNKILQRFQVNPVATYRRINAATFNVSKSQAPIFRKYLEAQGHKVYDSEKRRIVNPRASLGTPVTMEEVLQITKADSVQSAVGMNVASSGPAKILKAAARSVSDFLSRLSQPAIAVIDTGADLTHPLLKNVKKVVNLTSGENIDDVGHGTWVTSMVLNFASGLRNLTVYKAMANGEGTLDDLLKALTTAANDGNLVISNSWGSNEGDPQSPDSQLVMKLAQEGRIMVFAAGNAGPAANTIGSPAIAYFQDPTTKALRVLSVAAADRNKAIAFFSSRGPGSPATQNDPSYPHRPDLSAVGLSVEGAWPAALGTADRTDPVKGTLKAISGTSMSTPDVSGALALLAMIFGVTQAGALLDQLSKAVMGGLEKTGQSPDAEGQGFLNVEKAYQTLKSQAKPPAA